MGAFLGLGVTHYPLLSVADDRMADLLRWTLTDPGIPEAEKDPANWPALMRQEWADDGGTAAAANHRKQLREGLAACRRALDEFEPDVPVVWGDDQYENFREEAVPPFCVLAYGQTQVRPFGVMNERGAPNVWGRPDDMTFTLRGDEDGARLLTDALLTTGTCVRTPQRTSGSTTPSWPVTTTPGQLGMGLSWSELVVTDVFNSDKCFAIFDGKASA